MQNKSSIFFKVLLNRFHPGIGESFLRNLPQDEVKEIFKHTLTSQDPSAILKWPNTVLSRTHYSWLIPIIEKAPKKLQSLLIASLPEPQKQKIKKTLNIPEITEYLSPSLKAFFSAQLYKKWNPEEFLPIDYLPPTQLTPLLDLSKAKLVELIDFLAIYDLAEATRHIVDKKTLKAIYLCVEPKKQQFLRTCLHKKEKLVAPKINIEKWDRKQESLNPILHKRGLLRFGKALCGQDPSFVWNIVHTLDTGRGKIVSQYYTQNEIPGVTSILVQQVLTIINFLKQKSSP